MRRKFALDQFCRSGLIALALAACPVLASVPCSAQTSVQPQLQARNGVLRIDAWPNGYVRLSHGWRIHRGDDPSFASPDFDDRSWQTVTLYGLAYRQSPGVYWYRMRVQVPPQHGPLALDIAGVKGGYQIYLNGAQVSGTSLLPELQRIGSVRAIPLPPTGQDIEIAIRSVTSAVDSGQRPIDWVYLGTMKAMNSLSRDQTSTMLLGVNASLPIELACVVVGLGVLGLFYFQRQHKEYLWLGLYLAILGGSSFIYLSSTTTLLPLSFNLLFGDPILYLFTLLQVEFTFAFVHQKVSRPWRVYEVLLVASSLTSLVTNMHGLLHTFTYSFYETLMPMPAALILPVLLWFWYRKGNREAGLLVIPSIFPGLAAIFQNIGFVTRTLFHWRGLDFLSEPIRIGPMGFQIIDLFNLIFLLAIGVVIFLRFTEVSRAEARTAAELDAAREIQQTLVPVEPPRVEGYQLAAAYLPAQEVGGDFYQVLPQLDGSTIIALGDVSGKGLKAAMTGTLAIGMLRTLIARGLSPAEVLVALNDQVVAGQQGGFITMLCARIGADGHVTLANAGHLHPYHCGQEVELEAGLPLGIVSGHNYAERQITLAPGEQLTLLSDGIVEARNPSGELFGFERTQASSDKSAQQMAEMAKEFGQEDDITVLTLTRATTAVAFAEAMAGPAVPSPSPA